MSWVQHNLESREDLIERLMEHVRLPLMSQEYLVQRVEEEPLFKTNSRCKDFLIEAMKYHLLKHEQKITFKTPRTQPRNPIGLPKVCRKITLNTLTAQSHNPIGLPKVCRKITLNTLTAQPRNPIGLPKVCRKITLNTLTAQPYWFSQGL